MSRVSRVTRSRWPSVPVNGKPARILPHNHPAIVGRRTLYPTTVRQPSRGRAALWALKAGENSRKIGGLILKGRWTGLPVYTLTLEERATCPATCQHWRSCYGNDMQWAQRMQPGPDLEWRLVREVALLDIDHPNGFAVRLHNLGDFYSVEYVELWGRLLEGHPGLRVWGYTAHTDGPTAAALAALIGRYGDRFAIRFSNAPQPFALGPTTITIESERHKPTDAIVCPEQTGKTESCSTCALCWGSKRRIAFLQH